MKISSRIPCLGNGWWMVGLCLGLAPLTSMARIDIRVTQSGSQVNMTLTGSAKTGSLLLKPYTTMESNPAQLNAGGLLVVGAKQTGQLGSGNLTGPNHFGFFFFLRAASSGNGSWAGISSPYAKAKSGVLLPNGYTSGALLNGTATYLNQSLCSLGLTPGTYPWTWGTGANADSLVLTIDTPPPPPAPTMTSITPTSGPSTGGTNLKIAGTNFCWVTSINVGGVACPSFSVASPTSASCSTPAGTVGPASVVVTTPSGSNTANSLFTYKVLPPTVSAVSPQNGPVAGGTAISVTGTNLTGATGITVGGQACTNLNVTSATTATCTTSAGSAGSASVVVTTAGGSNIANTIFYYLGDCNGINQTLVGNYACIVAPGTTSLNYTVIGGSGGPEDSELTPALGGRAAKITGALAVTPGQTLFMRVGKKGHYNNGGDYSSISTTSATVGPVVVAGAGGGAGMRGNSSSTTSSGAGGHAGISTSPSGNGGGAGGGLGQPGLDGGQAASGGAGGLGSTATFNGNPGGIPGLPFISMTSKGGIGGCGFGGRMPSGNGAGGGNGGGGYAGGGGGGGVTPGGGGGGGSSLIPAGATAVLAVYDELPRVTLSGVAGSALTPASQTVNGTVGSAITATGAPTPSGFSGAVTYSISPALPAGLALNASTGVISGTPTAAQTTTPYTLTGTGASSGSATSTVSLSIDNGPALTPTLGTPTSTAAGYTVQISNYDASYTWSGTATAGGSVSINGTGLVTVTGLAPSATAIATINTTHTGYYNGNATVTGSASASLAAAISPSTQSISGAVGTSSAPPSRSAPAALAARSAMPSVRPCPPPCRWTPAPASSAAHRRRPCPWHRLRSRAPAPLRARPPPAWT